MKSYCHSPTFTIPHSQALDSSASYYMIISHNIIFCQIDKAEGTFSMAVNDTVGERVPCVSPYPISRLSALFYPIPTIAPFLNPTLSLFSV